MHLPRLIDDRQQLRGRCGHPSDDHLLAVRRAHTDRGNRSHRSRIGKHFARSVITEDVRSGAREWFGSGLAMHLDGSGAAVRRSAVETVAVIVVVVVVYAGVASSSSSRGEHGRGG